MQVLQEVAKVLHIDAEKLERESLKNFLEKELLKIDLEVYQIGSKHGIKSVLELDEKLRRGEVREEDIREDFMRLDYLESQREGILEALKKLS